MLDRAHSFSAGIPALQRDRWQLFAEAKHQAQPVPDLGIEDWRPLRLDPSLWSEAAEQQKAREISSPIADRLSTLYSELTATPRPLCLSNGRTVECGRDYIVGEQEVWISAKTVVELVGNFDPSGRNTAAAMRSLGWTRVKDDRSGALPSRVRGYVHPSAEG